MARFTTHIRLTGGALLVAVVLSGCSGQAKSGAAPAGDTASATSSDSASPAMKDEIIVRLWDNPASFDPALLFRVETENVAFQIYSGLTTYDATGAITPDLAESWDTTDAQTWTFHLRHGVKWQGDYGELTSADVLYSYNRVLDPATASPYRGEYANVASFSAPDDYTVVIALKAPDANFLHQVASYHQGQVLKREAVEKAGDQYALNPVGPGPFMLDHFTQNSEIVLNRFDGYYKGPAKLKRITYRIIKDDNTAEVALKNHEVDLVGQMADNGALNRLQEEPRLTFFKNPGYAINLTMFNTTFEPFSKPSIRKAFAYAIDRDAIIQAIAPLTQSHADNILPDWMPASTKDIPTYGYDPARARALLEEGGYPSGFTFKNTGIAASGGAPESDLLRQDYLAKVGIKMDFEYVESAVYNQRRNNGDFQLSGRLLPAANPDTILFGYLHPANTAPKGFNGARYDNAKVTSLLEQARSTLDADARYALYGQAERMVMDELPYFPMYQATVFWPAWSTVKGVAINKIGDVDMWPVTVEAN